LAGSTRALWPLAHGSQPILSLAQRWLVGSFAGVSTAAVQHAGEGELGTPLCGWHHGSCSSARGRSQGENPEGEALGRSQGGFSTKVHLRAEGGGKLMTLVLTPGQRHEAPMFPQLMAQGAVKGSKGRPRLRPHRAVGDKGYSSRAIRQYAHQCGIRITIPRKVNECRKGPCDRKLYKKRNLVERLINRLKQFRRLATRYEKRQPTIGRCG
jgi:transposase